MNVEDLVRAVVSGAVDDYLQQGDSPAGTAFETVEAESTGSTAAPAFGGYTVPAEASGRHVHLSPEDVEKLFGPGYELTPKRPLSQPGQYLSEERVALIGPKGTFRNVAVLGPPRGHTQVEVSASDARTLGLHPPVSLSGNLSGAADMLIASKDAFLMAEQSLIIAQNHVHLSPEAAAEAGVSDGDRVDVCMNTARPLTFHNVVVRSGPAHAPALHIDFDEANACGYETGDTATILGGTRAECAPEPEPAFSAVPAEPEDLAEPGTSVAPGDVVLSVTFLSEVKVRDALALGATAVVVPEHCVVSPLAKDLLHKHNVTLKTL